LLTGDTNRPFGRNTNAGKEAAEVSDEHAGVGSNAPTLPQIPRVYVILFIALPASHRSGSLP
jgi:hypothetical protein